MHRQPHLLKSTGPVAIVFIFLTLSTLLNTNLAGGSASAALQGSVPQIGGMYPAPLTAILTNCDSGFDGVTQGPFPGTITIHQTGSSFTAMMQHVIFGFLTDSSLTGTISAGGQMSGNIETVVDSELCCVGTFAGQVTAGTISLDLSETFFEDIFGSGCRITSNITIPRPLPTNANLTVTNTASPATVASGTQLTHTITVSNAGPDEATAVSVSESTPVDTTFASVVASHGTCATPHPGGTGAVVCSLGNIPSGGSATITFVVNVLAPSGSMLASTATLSTGSSDPVPGDNSATATATVQGGGVAILTWKQTPQTEGNQTPPPFDLTASASLPASPGLENDENFEALDHHCTITGYNIYISSTRPVQTTPANLWKTVPPVPLQANAPVAPAGSFYVMTTVWKCNDEVIESSPSNEANVPAGPTLNELSVGSKLKIKGNGFVPPAEVFIDGVKFSKSAKVKNNSLIQQKGKLENGKSIAETLTPGRKVLVTVRHSNGGIGSYSYTRP